MSRQEATAAATGGTHVPSAFEAALLVSAWAHETGRKREPWQEDMYVALLRAWKVKVYGARMHGKAAVKRDVEDLDRWLNEQDR